MKEAVYDTIILGGGPAGVAAGVYAARKKMRALLLTESFGGQSTVSATVENWIGEICIKGVDLKKKLESHVREFEKSGDLVIKQPSRATALKAEEKLYTVVAADGETFRTRTVILATGGRHRHLNVPGEKEFAGRGVVYCSTCDAPMFRGRKVAVIGTGNSGLEAVEDLLPYAAEITLIGNTAEVTGDPVTLERIRRQKDINIIYNAETYEIFGQTMVEGLRYRDISTGEEHTLEVQGVFVEIGTVPNSDLVRDLVDLDKYGQVIVDAARGTTSREGIFAAGDVTNVPYKQNNVAAGDAVKAVLSAYEYLKADK